MKTTHTVKNIKNIIQSELGFGISSKVAVKIKIALRNHVRYNANCTLNIVHAFGDIWS